MGIVERIGGFLQICFLEGESGFGLPILNVFVKGNQMQSKNSFAAGA